MEQHFLVVVKPAWGAADWAPPSQPGLWLFSEDSEPGPPPLSPVLGESAGHRDAYDGQLLSSPCWRLPSVYEPYRHLMGAQDSWEARPAQPSLGPSPEVPETPDTPEMPRTPETLETPSEGARQPQPTKETVSQRFSLALSPSAGDEQQMAENREGARPAERRPPPAPAGRRGHPDFSGCLQWIRRALSTLSRAAARCFGIFVDFKEP
ncbi:annexin-2 receptor-like [Glossophaga mutica]